jgi:hypothetical protein
LWSGRRLLSRCELVVVGTVASGCCDDGVHNAVFTSVPDHAFAPTRCAGGTRTGLDGTWNPRRKQHRTSMQCWARSGVLSSPGTMSGMYTV